MRILAVLFATACATHVDSSTIMILAPGESCPAADQTLQAEGDGCDHAEDCRAACCLCVDKTIGGPETRDHVVASCVTGACNSEHECPRTCGGL